ncbi:MAG: hypothetical protein AMJ46_10380 [Latescibacteria bacterium DG_63]|nr:MAG: hypothetical protein AMJ46_10380 [Latescibacteria bacterium DG_63]
MKAAILVNGVCGRMGAKVAELIAGAPDLQLAGGIERKGHPKAGRRLSLNGHEVSVTGGFERDVPSADLLVDFTTAEATDATLEFCVRRGMALVSGTTGHSQEKMKMMKRASQQIPILFSPNMSVGITLLVKVLPEIVRALGPDCDIEVIEKHHREKKDSPSGTALRLAETVANAAGRSDVSIHSLRAGGIVGEHTVVLALKGERMEIKHVAESRDCFAYGTLAAVRFLLGKPAGWYTMENVVFRPAV